MFFDIAIAIALSIVLTIVFFLSIVGVMYLSFSVTIYLIKKLMQQWKEEPGKESVDGHE